MTEIQYHAKLLQQISDIETQARELCSEAFTGGDTKTVKHCQAVLAKMQKNRSELRPPRAGVMFQPPTNKHN